MPTEEEIKQKLMHHDFAIENMAKSIGELAEVTKDSNIKLGEIAKSMSKQELILEKLANLEGNTKESINRIHKRCDGAEKRLEDVEKNGGEALKVFKEQMKTEIATIEANVKSNQKRLDANDKHKGFIVLAVVGAVLTAIMNTVLK